MATIAKKEGMDIGGLLQGITGITDLMTDKKTKTKTSGGTTTQTSGLEITDEGRQKMIQDLLESSSGLAETSSGQRRAGLYNSSTNQLLVNDLMDRVTSSVDRDTAKQVTTTVAPPTSTTQVAPARVGLGDAALGIGGAMAAKKIYDIFGGAGSVIEELPDFVPAFEGATQALDFMSSGADVAAGGVGAVSDMLDFGGFNFGGMPLMSMGMDLLSGEPEDAIASGLGFMAGNALLPGVGGPLGAVLGDIIPFDNILGDIGGMFGDLFGSVVCTELVRQGKLSTALYLADTTYAKNHASEKVLSGYRVWGIPLVRLMRKSAVVTAVAGFFAINRAHYIAAISGTTEYKMHKAAIGAVINTVGVPICYVIGSLLTKPVAKSVPLTA